MNGSEFGGWSLSEAQPKNALINIPPPQKKAEMIHSYGTTKIVLSLSIVCCATNIYKDQTPNLAIPW
jgi:hypothetical protein